MNRGEQNGPSPSRRSSTATAMPAPSNRP